MRLGATPSSDGTQFAIYSSVAESVELCLFDAQRKQTGSHRLANCDDGVWHDVISDCAPGQRYGYRIHGPWSPDTGMRCNPAKLMLDPYARRLDGEFIWDSSVFDYRLDKHKRIIARNEQDSAPFVPLSVVCEPDESPRHSRPRTPWKDTIFYECNVRGYTMLHPDVSAADRGRFVGMRNGEVLRYLKALGITAIELMPVQAFIDEHHLARQGLRNYWGYNTVGFFAPMPRYAGDDAVAEFQDMVRSIHDAGLEVILDVVYNHTGEGDGYGPSVSFRGIDNLSYYRVQPGNPAQYINDTGCGNTLNVDHPRTQDLVVDSLSYFATHYGVDGFRFDLATVLGRHADGFSASHPLLERISGATALRDLKLIAEPWDPGPGGYQVGQFPPRWAEWNDKFRDTVRQFWRGDAGRSGALAQRMHGSADLFEANGRPPYASVNFISSHDGYTLRDLVSYEQRHNLANGENNRDGHSHNYSCNYGVEGNSDDPDLLALRQRQSLNMLASVLFSQGTPMLLAGDEFGHSQGGNNNAYAQDNETSWLDWSKISTEADFLEHVRELIWLRRETPLLRIEEYVHGELQTHSDLIEIRWVNRDGEYKRDEEWFDSKAFTLMITATNQKARAHSYAIVINSNDHDIEFQLPHESGVWRLLYSTDAKRPELLDSTQCINMRNRSCALLRSG